MCNRNSSDQSAKRRSKAGKQRVLEHQRQTQHGRGQVPDFATIPVLPKVDQLASIDLFPVIVPPQHRGVALVVRVHP